MTIGLLVPHREMRELIPQILEALNLTEKLPIPGQMPKETQKTSDTDAIIEALPEMKFRTNNPTVSAVNTNNVPSYKLANSGQNDQ